MHSLLSGLMLFTVGSVVGKAVRNNNNTSSILVNAIEL